MNWLYNKIKFFDIPLLIVSGLLVSSGLAIQYAISLGEGNLQIFYKQLIYSGAALVTFILVANYNYQLLSKHNRIVYVLLIIGLIYLILFGDPIRGSARWIDFGFFQLQLAELAKIIIAIGLARWLSVNRGQINSWWNFLLTFLYAAIPAALIFLEPDLGSSAIVMIIWFGIILLSPLKKTFVLIFIGVAIILAGFSWQFLAKDYQKERVEVFLSPDKDPRGKGYNVRQAIIAVGSGQLFGRGAGRRWSLHLKRGL
jgi:rod shape determining protein RodA